MKVAFTVPGLVTQIGSYNINPSIQESLVQILAIFLVVPSNCYAAL